MVFNKEELELLSDIKVQYNKTSNIIELATNLEWKYPIEILYEYIVFFLNLKGKNDKTYIN